MWDIYKLELKQENFNSEFESIVSADETYIDKRHIELLVDIMVSLKYISIHDTVKRDKQDHWRSLKKV